MTTHNVPHLTPQPIPLSRQQPPVPAPFTHSPSYPAGWELIETINDSGGIIIERVSIGGELYERRFNTATGDSELRPLY